ncbi:rhodanese-like domain-containing protein [Nitratidesulfovibrio sp. SRB-5]|uniref:rhodanese-like domain-containing protein n=1 Tax=Nitratidesulfovibrio sp. SRB-5 TaxID=2872636 RepID=UPI00102577AE|nr:rhodanese-like domain-containing protein [Nitratidesulfovibrio sp. SRB-5]MBZ2171966.1 sulfurtransferase [Nitratidesulfovibrio sp. SRB-5]RXF78553.1 sulfurtransferase [Desulfovibrio sp. DS-1]
MSPSPRVPIESVSPQALRDFMAARPEGSYVLVDVRQPEEYRQEHIPGARLVPVGELARLLATLDPAQDHVFYCRSGGRSAAAAVMAAESGRFAAPSLGMGGTGATAGGRILNLTGGMNAWSAGPGQAVANSPRIQVFAGVRSMVELLRRALDMEKAAHLLYTRVRAAGPKPAVCALMDRLIGVELAHAKVVYHHLAQRWDADAHADATRGPLPPFDALFEALEGRVLEGGMAVADLEPWLRDAASGDCLDIAELALEVEMNAYDLYRTLADEARRGSGLGGLAERAFLDLATQEKTHARMIIDQIATFSTDGEDR